MTESIIISSHAESNGKTFKLGRDIVFYCVKGDSLDHSTAYVLLTKLRALDGVSDDVAAFWKSKVEEQYETQLVDHYAKGTDIPDYDIWDLESSWADDTGIFAFAKDTPRLETLGSGKLLSTVLKADTEIDTVFWLACNA